MGTFVNQTASFERAKKMLAEIRAAAKAGDKYAIELLALYDGNNPAAIWMPWPEKKNEKNDGHTKD